MANTDYRHFRVAAAALRWTGMLGAGYSLLLMLGELGAWAMQFGATWQGVHFPAGPIVTGYLLRVIVFLLAYAVGAALPILVRPETPAEPPRE